MQPQTFIFFGPSGSGKGTQAKLVQEELKKKDPERDIIYVETGSKFRELAEGDSYTAKLIKDILNKGELTPEFLPIWIWTEYLVKNVSGDEHLFFDGSPRKPDEAFILDSAIRFYKRKNPIVISLEVSHEWATKLLKNRGRSDDNDEEIKKRLDWYDENVVEAMTYFKNNPDYRFIPINGERTIEEVHKDMMNQIGL